MYNPEPRRHFCGNLLRPMLPGVVLRVFEEPVYCVFRFTIPELRLAPHFLGFKDPFRLDFNDWVRVRHGDRFAQSASHRYGSVHQEPPEAFAVVGIDRLPAELPFQIIRGRLLNERVFGVGCRCHRRLCRHRADAIEGDAGVPGDENQSFGLSLGDQHPIERVAVVRRKGAGLLCVMKRQR